jgi:hypothetical protein
MPVKRSARKPKPKPKLGWSESPTRKKREQPVFNPEKHVWNKMKVCPQFPLIVSYFGLPISNVQCTHCAQRVRAPERPCFSFKSGPRRCARCVFDNARCHPSNSEETGGLEATGPQEAAPEAETPTPMMPAAVRTAAAALDTPTPSSSNLLSTLPPNMTGTPTAQSLTASIWSPGSVPSLAATPSPFAFFPGLPHIGGQLLTTSHQHQSPFSTIGFDIAAEIQVLYARARWMQENTQEMMKRIQELETLLGRFSSV